MLVKGAIGDDAEDGSVEQAMAPPLPPEKDAINTQVSNLYIEGFFFQFVLHAISAQWILSISALDHWLRQDNHFTHDKFNWDRCVHIVLICL